MGQAGSHERQRQRPRRSWQRNFWGMQFTYTVHGEPQPGVPQNPNARAPQPAAPLPAPAAVPPVAAPAAANPPVHVDRRIARESNDHPEIWTCNPCIARDTWQANRTWRLFVYRFLRHPDAVFLRQGEDECPICFRLYWEDNDMRPVRLPCDSQHVICLFCAIRWFKGGTLLQEAKNKCPSCRQVMRQTSAEIEQFVTAMWNAALMRYSDQKLADA
ncbi:hypothetical protein PRZ48_004043 [Zasmidium cellare]|uniref:RING-type domain-containing protein n=1 Tax=Zasmidium cellare TaxID=395010 RepID=A0ABR0EZ39_ZASCE|nr:hypothetical protein PRZ48_004043 [Zasmidium cellare]